MQATATPLPATWDAVRAVWLLVGSTGATAAVQRFLAGFRRCPPVAFVYAQHYDPARQEQLRQLTPGNPAFHMELVEDFHRLVPGRVLIVPPRHRVVFGPRGQVCAGAEGWGTGHTPDIDELQVLFAAARFPATGIILFSGMGNDGAGGLDILDATGARIWIQDPATAACGGIPLAAAATGRVHRSGSPEALARAMEQIYED